MTTKSIVKALHFINEYDKYPIAASVGAMVLLNWSVRSVWMLLGALVNAVVCKVLKKLINQPRPGSANFTDAGMPSSHACSITFLSLTASLLVLSRNEVPTETSTATVLQVVGILAAGLTLSVLRKFCGDHTVAQVRRTQYHSRDFNGMTECGALFRLELGWQSGRSTPLRGTPCSEAPIDASWRSLHVFIAGFGSRIPASRPFKARHKRQMFCE